MARDGRSQHRNKVLAFQRLQALLRQQQILAQAGAAQRQNLLHHQLERGNPVRLFKGERFKEQRPKRR